MEFRRIRTEDMPGLKRLQCAYKQEIGEEAPDETGFERLRAAIAEEKILFFGAFSEGEAVACCSVSPTFSTFDYRRSGVFEDFYVVPGYRHRGIARKLLEIARLESGVSTLTVGCADCDAAMYRALGFTIPLGNLLAFGE